MRRRSCEIRSSREPEVQVWQDGTIDDGNSIDSSVSREENGSKSNSCTSKTLDVMTIVSETLPKKPKRKVGRPRKVAPDEAIVDQENLHPNKIKDEEKDNLKGAPKVPSSTVGTRCSTRTPKPVQVLNMTSTRTSTRTRTRRAEYTLTTASESSSIGSSVLMSDVSKGSVDEESSYAPSTETAFSTNTSSGWSSSASGGSLQRNRSTESTGETKNQNSDSFQKEDNGSKSTQALTAPAKKRQITLQQSFASAKGSQAPVLSPTSSPSESVFSMANLPLDSDGSNSRRDSAVSDLTVCTTMNTPDSTQAVLPESVSYVHGAVEMNLKSATKSPAHIKSTTKKAPQDKVPVRDYIAPRALFSTSGTDVDTGSLPTRNTTWSSSDISSPAISEVSSDADTVVLAGSEGASQDTDEVELCAAQPTSVSTPLRPHETSSPMSTLTANSSCIVSFSSDSSTQSSSAAAVADQSVQGGILLMQNCPQFVRSATLFYKQQISKQHGWGAKDVLAICVLASTLSICSPESTDTSYIMHNVLNVLEPVFSTFCAIMGNTKNEENVPVEDSTSHSTKSRKSCRIGSKYNVSIGPNKHRVRFSQVDGGGGDPPNDRYPRSWQQRYQRMHHFSTLLRSIWDCHLDSVTNGSPYGLLARAALQCATSIQHLGTANSRIYQIVQQNLSGEVTFETSELAELCKAVHEELHLLGIRHVSETNGAFMLPKLSNSASWMANSIIRFTLRYIYDVEPYQITTPGLGGPVDYSDCRSGLHHTFKLCSRHNKRMQQLCLGASKGQKRISIGPNQQSYDLDAVHKALPTVSDCVDPKDMSTSTLMAYALEQILAAVNLVVSYDPCKSGKSCADILTADCLSDAMNLTALATSVLDNDEAPGEQLQYGRLQEISDIAQTIIAAEYARRFLKELTLIPGVDAVHLNELPSSSLPSPSPLSNASPAKSNAWCVLSQSAQVLADISMQYSQGIHDRATAVKSAHLMIFFGGFEKYQERISLPFIKSGVISACQCAFQKALIADWANRIEISQSTCSTYSKASRSPETTESTEVDPNLFDSVYRGVLFDFPGVALN